MKVVAIIQARMGSTRLPGKVMLKIVGRTVLEHVIERVKASKEINEIVITTTTKEDDNVIVEEAQRLGAKFYRGSEDDVLSRYYYAAKENEADIVVRITSDCPVIDPQIADEMINNYIRNNKQDQIDYMSNTLELSFPRGLDVEIFTFDALQRAHINGKLQYEREHVTPYLYLNPDMFQLRVFKSDTNYSEYRWTLDTEHDLEVIKAIYDGLYDENRMFYFKDVLNFINHNSHLLKINQGVKQKVLGD